jgi:hypothetical protein
MEKLSTPIRKGKSVMFDFYGSVLLCEVVVTVAIGLFGYLRDERQHRMLQRQLSFQNRQQ